MMCVGEGETSSPYSATESPLFHDSRPVCCADKTPTSTLPATMMSNLDAWCLLQNLSYAYEGTTILPAISWFLARRFVGVDAMYMCILRVYHPSSLSCLGAITRSTSTPRKNTPFRDDTAGFDDGCQGGERGVRLKHHIIRQPNLMKF